MSYVTIRAGDVIGNLTELSEGRLVFVGTSKAHPEIMFICFRNRLGNDTPIALSIEAFDALKDAASAVQNGQGVAFPFQLQSEQIYHWEFLTKVPEGGVP